MIITAMVHINENNWTATGTIFMAGLAGISIVYSSMTISLMKEEARPNVFIDFVIDEDAPSLIDIEISNYGKGAAYDLKMEVCAPEKEKEMRDNKAIFQTVSSMSIFKNQLHLLGPDRTIRIRFGIGHIINQYLPFEYTFNITYSNCFGKEYSDSIVIGPMYLMSCSSNLKKTDELLSEINKEIINSKNVLSDMGSSLKVLSGELMICPMCKECLISPKMKCCRLCDDELIVSSGHP